MHKRVRILEAYAVVSLLIFTVLAFSAFKQTSQKFDEISVQRLNLVEKNGQLRAVMANQDRMPDPVVNGKTFKGERPPGIIFYNGLGDENGGLVFGAANLGGDKYGANGQLTFDQYKQSQVVALMYSDHPGSREAGLVLWDRPDTPITDLIERQEVIEKMPDGPEKESARNRLREAKFSPRRIFVGKSKEHEAKVTLFDAKGHARINMLVDASGAPRLDFLDEDGKVTYSLPAAVADQKNEKIGSR